MERLTVKRNGVWHFEDWERGIDCTGKAIDRLAAYEDTGLEPDMVVKTAELAFFVHENGLDRLRDLLAAEKDGRLVVLPCKVGDSGAWVHNGTMTPVHVHRIQINKRGTFLVLKSTVVHGAFPVDQIGKTVFLPRAEAEAAAGAAGTFIKKQPHF